MATALDERDLERDVVQLVVREAMKVALATPLREPILEAVESTGGEAVDGDRSGTGSRDDVPGEATGETEVPGGDATIARDTEASDEERSEIGTDDGGSSRLVSAVQGLAVFLVMFSVMYVVLRRLTGEDS